MIGMKKFRKLIYPGQAVVTGNLRLHADLAFISNNNIVICIVIRGMLTALYGRTMQAN